MLSVTWPEVSGRYSPRSRQTSSLICGRYSPTPRLTSYDTCRRPRTTSAADLGEGLRQTSEHICGRGWRVPVADLRRSHLSSVLSPFFHELDRPSHIFRRIDADGFLMGDANLYPIAVLQPAQLFQALGFFQFRLG